MKFLFASDSFKGSLSSQEIAELLTEAAHKVFPECRTKGVIVADGGEGTVDAVLAATEGVYKKVMVHGPLMEPVQAAYGVIDNNHAVIEMSAASGLTLVPAGERNPLNTTTYGTGELIKDALESGYRKITVAVGGSATNDGGMGAMKALGIRFLDAQGVELSGRGRDLARVHSIDIKGLHKSVLQTEFTVMCDVSNPLTGENGAAYTFGRQKGGTGAILDELEKGMVNYSNIIRETTGIDPEGIPGSGAAGGLGGALCIFLHGIVKPGIERMLDMIHFDHLLEGVDLVVTGEGCLDWQSSFGKVPSGVGMRCRNKKIPVIAIVGGMGEGADRIYDSGIETILPIVNGPMSLENAMSSAPQLYREAAERMFHMLSIGKRLS